MSHHQRRNAAARTAVVPVNIAAANAAGLYLDEHVAGTQGGDGKVAKMEVKRGLQEKGFHLCNNNPIVLRPGLPASQKPNMHATDPQCLLIRSESVCSLR